MKITNNKVLQSAFCHFTLIIIIYILQGWYIIHPCNILDIWIFIIGKRCLKKVNFLLQGLPSQSSHTSFFRCSKWSDWSIKATLSILVLTTWFLNLKTSIRYLPRLKFWVLQGLPASHRITPYKVVTIMSGMFFRDLRNWFKLYTSECLRVFIAW